jgi:hypothetical protein
LYARTHFDLLAGEEAMRLTAKGEQVANQAAMGRDDDTAVLLDALLEAQG